MRTPFTLNNDLLPLANRYWVMRHGESEGNRAGIIVSDPADGVDRFGLTDRGRAQARENGERFLETCSDDPCRFRIISSDFLRARQTAAIVAAVLNVSTQVAVHAGLRERFFGSLEGQSAESYRRVWELDEQDASHEAWSVESAQAVCRRAIAVVGELEADFQGERFLLVAHGDVLQILQTVFECQPVSRHRAVAHLEVAEIRELQYGDK